MSYDASNLAYRVREKFYATIHAQTNAVSIYDLIGSPPWVMSAFVRQSLLSHGEWIDLRITWELCDLADLLLV